MRAQTSSYVVSTKVSFPESITKRLEKSLRISNSAYNEALSFGLKRFEALKQNSQYQELLEARRPVAAELAALKKAKKKDKALSKQVKDYNDALFELRKAYSLTESELQNTLLSDDENLVLLTSNSTPVKFRSLPLKPIKP